MSNERVLEPSDRRVGFGNDKLDFGSVSALAFNRYEAARSDSFRQRAGLLFEACNELVVVAVFFVAGVAVGLAN